MERRPKKHIAWRRYLVSAAFLLLLAIFFGGKYCVLLDFPGYFACTALHLPIHTFIHTLRPSPKGTWQIKIFKRQWTYHDASDMSSDDVYAWRGGQPFLGGRSLESNYAGRLLNAWTPIWHSDSILEFANPFAAGQPAVALTIKNTTSRTLPYVFLFFAQQQAYYLFALPPHSQQQLKCARLKAGDYLTCTIGPDALSNYKQCPAMTSGKTLSGMNVLLADKTAPQIAFDFLPASRPRN